MRRNNALGSLDNRQTTTSRNIPVYTAFQQKDVLGSPHLHGVIQAPRSDACAIRRPGYCKHSARMVYVGIEVAAISRIPHLHGIINAPRGDACAIRRPGYCAHPSGMACVGIQGGSYWSCIRVGWKDVRPRPPHGTPSCRHQQRQASDDTAA